MLGSGVEDAVQHLAMGCCKRCISCQVAIRTPLVFARLAHGATLSDGVRSSLWRMRHRLSRPVGAFSSGGPGSEAKRPLAAHRAPRLGLSRVASGARRGGRFPRHTRSSSGGSLPSSDCPVGCLACSIVARGGGTRARPLAGPGRVSRVRCIRSMFSVLRGRGTMRTCSVGRCHPIREGAQRVSFAAVSARGCAERRRSGARIARCPGAVFGHCSSSRVGSA